jgi:GNAT superfamily N-acetyltransferase
MFGPELNEALNPDWRASQEREVRAACVDGQDRVWVAELDARLAGFVAARIWEDGRIGEIDLLAVDPQSQGRGVGTALTEHAIAWIRVECVPVAMVGTGSDPGHAPARRTYEKAGMKLIPMSRYFLRL